MHDTDYTTHLKIVAVAFIAVIVFAGIGESARPQAPSVQVIKAGKPLAVSTSDSRLIR